MRSETGPSGRRYHFNGDFSGDVWMDVSSFSVEKETDLAGEESYSVTVEVADIEWLAGLIAKSKQAEEG